MGLFSNNKFGKKKNDNVRETITYDQLGEEVHVFDGLHGEMRIKKLHAADYLYSGEEWCPECHVLMSHKDGYWECDICKHSITDEESECGDGYPTLASTYENDYGEYYGG